MRQYIFASDILRVFLRVVTVHTINKTLATGRSDKMAITLCFQNASQIRLAYGKEFVNVEVTQGMLLENFHSIRDDIAALIHSELDRISSTPELRQLLIE